MTPLHRGLGAIALTFLGACASSPQAERADAPGGETLAVESEDSAATRQRPADDVSATPEAPPAPDDAEPLASDPYQGRPGAEEDPQDAAPAHVPFEPSSTPELVKASDRPPLPARARLGVAFVRRGRVVAHPDALLKLEPLLGDAPELSAVLALRLPDVESLDWVGLAAAASEQERELLLVDVIADEQRWAFVLHAESGALLARYRASEKGVSVAEGAEGDLLARLERAYARWTAR